MAVSLAKDQGTAAIIISFHVPHDVSKWCNIPIQQMPWFMQDIAKVIP